MNAIHHDRRGVRRIIVSDDQARNLAELDAQQDEIDAAAEVAGEESQDPGDWEPA